MTIPKEQQVDVERMRAVADDVASAITKQPGTLGRPTTLPYCPVYTPNRDEAVTLLRVAAAELTSLRESVARLQEKATLLPDGHGNTFKVSDFDDVKDWGGDL